MKVVAIIPARGGSKEIPSKNIRPICEKPLIYWVCKAASDSAFIDEVYVSTDDANIADIVRSFNLPKVSSIDRPEETATDTASTESVVLDFAHRVPFDSLFLIQATSPLLSKADLAGAWNLWGSGDFESILSVVQQKRFIWEAGEQNSAIPKNYDPASRPRRQAFEGYLVENGAFYLTSRAALLESSCRLSGRVGYQEMSSESYLELDQPEDWDIVEALLFKQLREQSTSP